MYQIGEVIKRTRQSLGMTQETLSDGICSVETLSRIENGKHVPSRSNFQALMERMGKCGERYLPFIRSDDMELLEEWRDIERTYLKRKYQEVEVMLDMFEHRIDVKNPINFQQIIRMRAINDYERGKINEREKRKKLFDALRCTMPNCKERDFAFNTLSRCEIRILCNIGASYAEEGDLEQAIVLFRKLEQYFSNTVIDRTERNISEIMLISNLSQTLGRNGDTKEALEMGERGIERCLQAGEGTVLALFLYNVGFEMELLQMEEEYCKERLLQAYYIAELNENKKQMDHIAKHWKKQYGYPIDD